MLNSATIKSIQDIMRKDVGVDGDAQRIGQLTWMIFLKIGEGVKTRIKEKLLADYQQLLSELQGTRYRLKDELMKALQR